MMTKTSLAVCLACLAAAFATVSAAYARPSSLDGQAKEILQRCEVKGGFIVHIGCGDGRLTAALRASDAYWVHGLDRDAALVEKAREQFKSLGINGPVSADLLRGDRLPYVDNLVNLVVAEDLGPVSMKEVTRVLCPEGVAYIMRDGRWTQSVKPRPDEIDEWTHFLYDAKNNAVSHDDVVGPPRHMQWVGGPKYSRHHDRMSSVSTVVTSGGRVFYITDEASCVSILIPPRWSLVARDAFNGTVLWKRRIENWHTHLWPLKSGPTQLARRLVAKDDRVYVTLRLDAPVSALDAATGETLGTFEKTRGAEEIILSDGVLLALVNPQAEEPEYAGMERIKTAYRDPFWDEAPRQVVAVNGETGVVLWSRSSTVLPETLAADRQGVFYHDGERVVCLDRGTGEERWRSDPIPRSEIIPSFFAPTLVVYRNVILFSGGEQAGQQTGGWYTEGEDTMTALSAETGEVLWKAYHPPSGYRSPEDLLVANGLVWTGETLSGRVEGKFTGRDPFTGEVKRAFTPDVDTYWFHHRCYRGKATDNYLIMSRTGTEFIDLKTNQWLTNHWVRGACLYGIMPANGLLYAPQHPCACYLEAKMYGFCALAPASEQGPASERSGSFPSGDDRLERGPAYGAIKGRGTDAGAAEGVAKGAAEGGEGDGWPTFRHNPSRSGCTDTKVPSRLKKTWRTAVGGRLTQPVVAKGRLVVASIDTHTLHVLHADTGEPLWQYTTGGRIDSPPTVFADHVFFGSADGWLYCLRLDDGLLAWRFLAAHRDRRLMAFEQLESVWPVSGSVLLLDGASSASGREELWCVAGRSMFLDRGLLLWRLDPVTGRVLSRTELDGHSREAGTALQDYVSWLNMPTGLPDILSRDGRFVYMRSQPFNLDGTRKALESMPRGADPDQGAPKPRQDPEYAHLFCPTGFLDDTWWHRTYWLYGSEFISGWSGYYLAGRVSPAGRILVFDDAKVYGFGRKPKYYRWTTPIEHHLFAAEKITSSSNEEGSLILIGKSKSLNPAGTALTVEARVQAQNRNGVVFTSGGSSHGFALYLKGGKPHFAVRVENEAAIAASGQALSDQWVHLAGVLTETKEVRLYVDGALAASAKAPGFIAQQPAEGLVIGAEEGSCVGDYDGPLPFKGLIDEVRCYHRALDKNRISRHARGAAASPADQEGLVCWYTFEGGEARDLSGNNNHGEAGGVVPAKGLTGTALFFNGKPRSSKEFRVQHDWTSDLPLLARAMVNAGGTLFIGGPPDLIDEEEVFAEIDDPRFRQSLVDQAKAINGDGGGLLLAVSTEDGKELARRPLESPPVFDGLIAAGGRLYLSAMDGSVICLGQ